MLENRHQARGLQLHSTAEATLHQPLAPAQAPTAATARVLSHAGPNDGGSAVDDCCSPFGHQERLSCRQQDEAEKDSRTRQWL